MRHGQGRAMNALAAALASTPGGAVQHPGGSVRWGGQQFSDPGSLVHWINQHGGHSDVASFLGSHPGAASIFAGHGQPPTAEPGPPLEEPHGRLMPLPQPVNDGGGSFTAPQGGLSHALGPPIAQGPRRLGPPVHRGPRLLGPPQRRGIAGALTL